MPSREEAVTPARYNADPQRLHEVSGCAGGLAVFAVGLDTFPAEASETVYYVGTNDTAQRSALRPRLLTETVGAEAWFRCTSAEAKPGLASFDETLDPTNSVNPGIGKTSKQRRTPVTQDSA